MEDFDNDFELAAAHQSKSTSDIIYAKAGVSYLLALKPGMKGILWTYYTMEAPGGRGRRIYDPEKHGKAQHEQAYAVSVKVLENDTFVPKIMTLSKLEWDRCGEQIRKDAENGNPFLLGLKKRDEAGKKLTVLEVEKPLIESYKKKLSESPFFSVEDMKKILHEREAAFAKNASNAAANSSQGEMDYKPKNGGGSGGGAAVPPAPDAFNPGVNYDEQPMNEALAERVRAALKKDMSKKDAFFAKVGVGKIAELKAGHTAVVTQWLKEAEGGPAPAADLDPDGL